MIFNYYITINFFLNKTYYFIGNQKKIWLLHPVGMTKCPSQPHTCTPRTSIPTHLCCGCRRHRDRSPTSGPWSFHTRRHRHDHHLEKECLPSHLPIHECGQTREGKAPQEKQPGPETDHA